MPNDNKQLVQNKCASNLLAALDLMELGIELKRQNIARKNPSASSSEILRELQNWLEDPHSRS